MDWDRGWDVKLSKVNLIVVMEISKVIIILIKFNVIEEFRNRKG